MKYEKASLLKQSHLKPATCHRPHKQIKYVFLYFEVQLFKVELILHASTVKRNTFIKISSVEAATALPGISHYSITSAYSASFLTELGFCSFISPPKSLQGKDHISPWCYPQPSAWLRNHTTSPKWQAIGHWTRFCP